MALTERVSFILGVNSKGVVKEFDKVGRAADKSLGKAENKIDKLGATFTKVGAGMLGAAGLAGAALFSTVGAASDLAEAVNVTGLTFGDSADEMEDWADTAATSLGQSKRSALEGAAAIGGLLKNVGFLEDESAELSRKLVVLSSDMGSAFNMEPADALAALRSGLAGESEPLKRFNVFISEAAVKAKAFELGLSDGTRALSDNEKAQARLAIIMEQTADIQGDFANTADGAANAQRVLAAQMEDAKASIGQALLPVMEQLLGVTNDLLGAWNSLSPETQKNIAKFAVLATAVVGLTGGMSLAVGQAIKMRDALRGLRTGGLSKAQLATGALTLAVAGLAAAWKNHNDKAEKAKQLAADFAGAMRDAESPTEGVRTQLVAMAEASPDFAALFAKLPGGVEAAASALANGGDELEGFRQKLIDAEGQVGGMIVFDALTAAIDDATEHNEDLNKSLEETAAGTAGKRINAMLGEATDNVVKWANAADEGESKTSGFTSSLRDQATKFNEIRDAAAEARGEIESYFGIVRSETELQLDWEESIDGLVESMKDNGAELDVTTKAGQANRREALRNLGVLEDVIDARLEETGSIKEAQKAGEDYANQLINEMAEALGISTLEAAGLVSELGLIPGEYVATISADGAQALADAKTFEKLMEDITNKDWVAALTFKQNGGPSLGSLFSGTDGSSTVSAPAGTVPAGGLSDTQPQSGGGFSKGGSSLGGRSPVVHTTINVDGIKLAHAVAQGSQKAGGVPIKVVGAR